MSGTQTGLAGNKKDYREAFVFHVFLESLEGSSSGVFPPKLRP